MTLQPLLLALALAPAGAQDSLPRPRVSYRATVSLDEGTRQLRGTVDIVVRDLAASPALALEPGPGRTAPLALDPPRPGPARPGDAPLALKAAPGADAGTTSVRVELAAPDESTGHVSNLPLDRHFEFGAWLPRVLERAGGSPVRGTFLVRLDVPEDQVVAATGVPLCGDPGWAAARRARPDTVAFSRNAYAEPQDAAARGLPPDACARRAPGRKTLVWYAEDVPDFAVTMDPQFRYEEGDFLGRPVRALYRPEDERSWGGKVAESRAEVALAWLHELFNDRSRGLFPWAQITTVHRRLSGGAVNAMVAAPDSSDRRSILHALGRMFVARAIAVPPADSIWLDEGLTRFQADLYAETQGRRWTYAYLERGVLDEELDGVARPVLPSAATVTRGDAARRAEFLLYQLRGATGDRPMRRILQAYWGAARLGAGGEPRFVAAADSIAGHALGTRLAAALRESALVDYAVGSVARVSLPGGRWRTTVEVRRRGGGQFPLDVSVEADGDTAWATSSGAASRDTVVIETSTRPRVVVLDPRGRSHDWNVLNNRRVLGFHVGPDAPVANGRDPYLSRPTRRDRLVRSWAPVGWYNDAGGWTVGLRRRDDYLGRFDLNVLSVTVATGAGVPGARKQVDWRVQLRNPTWLRAPGLEQRLEAGRIEGRTLVSAGVARSRGPRSVGAALSWVDANGGAYLDSALYERASTVELTARAGTGTEGARGRLEGSVALGGGVAFRHSPDAGVRERAPYARATVQVVGERRLGAAHLRGRAFGGIAMASGGVTRQRRIYFAGSDPYELLDSPFLRSRGALFLRPGFHYHAPGGAGLRGFVPTLGGEQGYGLDLEAERDVVRRTGGLARRVAIAAFWDGALGDGDLRPERRSRIGAAADAGLGLRIDHRLGTTDFQTRLDLPLWVSSPAIAQDQAPGARRTALRWTCSLTPAF